MCAANHYTLVTNAPLNYGPYWDELLTHVDNIPLPSWLSVREEIRVLFYRLECTIPTEIAKYIPYKTSFHPFQPIPRLNEHPHGDDYAMRSHFVTAGYFHAIVCEVEEKIQRFCEHDEYFIESLGDLSREMARLRTLLNIVSTIVLTAQMQTNAATEENTEESWLEEMNFEFDETTEFEPEETVVEPEETIEEYTLDDGDDSGVSDLSSDSDTPRTGSKFHSPTSSTSSLPPYVEDDDFLDDDIDGEQLLDEIERHCEDYRNDAAILPVFSCPALVFSREELDAFALATAEPLPVYPFELGLRQDAVVLPAPPGFPHPTRVRSSIKEESVNAFETFSLVLPDPLPVYRFELEAGWRPFSCAPFDEKKVEERGGVHANPYFDSLSFRSDDMSSHPLFTQYETFVDPSEFRAVEPTPTIPYWDEDHMKPVIATMKRNGQKHLASTIEKTIKKSVNMPTLSFPNNTFSPIRAS